MRARPRVVAGLTVSALLLGPAAAGAQAEASSAGSPAVEPATFWWEGSLGSGTTQVSCAICQTSFDTGPFVSVAAGAYATPRIALGVELGGWTHRQADVREAILQGSIGLRYARDPRRGIHFLAGAGWMQYRAEDFRYHSPQLQMGVGWSTPLRGTWSAGARVLTDVAPLGTLRNGDDTVAEGVRVGTLRLSLFLRRR